MALFSRSYLTSEQLELSRIAASSSPSGPSDSQQQTLQSTSLLRSTRNIPPELRAPPYNPDEQLAQVSEEVEDPFNQRDKGEAREEPAEERDLFVEPATTLSSSRQSDSKSPEKEKKRARTSQIGKMLFPPSSEVVDGSKGSPRTKRHSYSGSASTAPQVVLNPLSASTSSLPIHTSRLPTHTLKNSTKKTLSPTNAHRRTASLAMTTSSSSSSSSSSQSSSATSHSSFHEGTLLALPLAEQLRSLKERNNTLAQASTTSNSKLVKATERIKQLEESLASLEASRGVDAEGWEAEASRLAQELSLLQRQQLDRPNVEELESRMSARERALAVEQAKKRRAKEMINKLKCELINRRWKEKYEIELLEKEERNWEIKVVETECELAIVKGELSCERAEREELEHIVATQKKRIGALAASRELLLDSCKTSEETISNLRTSLSEAQSTSTERDETIKKLRKEVRDVKEELAEATTKSGAGESKLREKNEKLDAEVKDLKTQLKTSQTALKASQKTTTSTTVSLETTQEALAALQAKYDALLSTSTPSSAKAKSIVKEKKRPQPLPEPDSDVEIEEEEEIAEPSPKRAKVKETKPKEKKVVVPKKKAVEPIESEEDSEDTVKAVKEKAKVVSKPSKAAGKKVSKIVEQSEAEEEEEEDDEETPRPTPASPPAAKKRKAGVLADKTTNSAKETGTTTKVKKDKSGGAEKKKKLSLDLSEDERPAPKEKAKEEPAKKKKRKLFGDGAKKGFDWQTQIENADVNGLIPGNLSPIKLDRSKKTGFMGFGGGAGAKKSIF